MLNIFLKILFVRCGIEKRMKNLIYNFLFRFVQFQYDEVVGATHICDIERFRQITVERHWNASNVRNALLKIISRSAKSF